MPKIAKQVARPKRSVKKRRKKVSIADQIESLADDSDKLKIAIYGKSGTGKTTLWATFPGKILAIICSGSKNPGETKSIKTKENLKRIDKLVLKTSTDLGALIESDVIDKYDTVVIDHITDLQLLTLREILGLEKLPEQLNWGLATRNQYGQCSLQTKELLRAVLDLDKNVVLVAQERVFKPEAEEDEGIIFPYVGPALTPATVGWLNPACDYIVHTFVRNKMVRKTVKLRGKTKQRVVRGKGVEYCLRCGPDETYTTKFRVPKDYVKPDVLVDAEYDDIITIINGTYKEK